MTRTREDSALPAAHLPPGIMSESGDPTNTVRADTEPRSVLVLLRDPVALTILLSTVLLLIVFYHRGEFAWLPEHLRMARIGWFGLNFVCLFIVPVVFARFVLRMPVADIGLQVGDWRLSLKYFALFGGVTIPTILIASRWGDFQGYYGRYIWLREDIPLLLVAQVGWGFYFFAWEFFFRGFLLQVLGRRFGAMAIILQTVPFVMMHFAKPEAESFAAIIAGVALGWWAWRVRSFVGAWLLHWLCSATMIMSVLYWHSGAPGV